MINYAIPGLYENWQVNALVVANLKSNSNIFYDNININAVFGNFPFCVWDGGRIFNENLNHATKEQIETIRHILNDRYKIPMRFVFTNSLLTEADCKDRFCNLVCEICHNELNEIVLNSPILEKYIRENYPKYKIISSTTKCITNLQDVYNEFNNDYYKICLDFNLNHNKKLLEDLSKSANKDKIELLVNAICSAGCPFRKDHYKLNSEYYLSYGKKYNMEGCTIYSNALSPKDGYHKNNLDFKEIAEYYDKYGINNFKLEGRTFNAIEQTCMLALYMVKPEYQSLFINFILQNYSKLAYLDLLSLEKYQLFV